MSIKKLIGILLAFVVFGALAYPKLEPMFSTSENEGQSGGGPTTLSVSGATVQPQPVDNKIFTTGTILANEEVELRSEISGKITEIYLDEGQLVKEGQLLLKINDSELQAQKTRARYRLDLAEERETRQRKLLEKGGISQEDYDATLNEVNVLRSELKLIEAQIAKTELRAPFNGKIGLKYVSEGSYISPSTRIASLQNINPVKIDFSIPERYVNLVENGDRITFTVQGTDKTFKGEIYAIEPKIESQTRTLQLRARSGNEEGLLVPGAFADLELILETIDNALMVPSISLVPELGGHKVFVYKDGTVEQRSVTTGIRTEKMVQVTGGLEPGDTVLTTGLLQVRPGMQVNLKDVTQ